MVSERHPDVRAPGDPLSRDRRVFVIFNPASGRGRGARAIATYRDLLTRHVPGHEHTITTRPGEERELADRALQEGFDVLVAAGGDGTWSNVADRLVASGAEAALGLLPTGTGNDFGRNLGIRYGSPLEAVKALRAGHTRRVDVGYVATPSASRHEPDRLEPRHFINVLGFGFDIAVIDAAEGARFLRGELLYKMTALQQLFRFSGIEAAVEGPAVGERRGRHLMLTVSNGPHFGGGFPIAPAAALDDGLLHACRISDARPLKRLRLFNLAEKGAHASSPAVEILPDREFLLTFPSPPRFEIDGDVRTTPGLQLDVQVLPGRLSVIAPSPTA